MAAYETRSTAAETSINVAKSPPLIRKRDDRYSERRELCILSQQMLIDVDPNAPGVPQQYVEGTLKHGDWCKLELGNNQGAGVRVYIISRGGVSRTHSKRITDA
ncbi:hypothetical protein ABW19_dt0207872 [Dactylella cylindrospora]|nr:hypothetical protein ABW19_dt0207872 [Dactylella cylindrospora]